MSQQSDLIEMLERVATEYDGNMKQMIIDNNLNKNKCNIENAYDIDQLQKLADATHVTYGIESSHSLTNVTRVTTTNPLEQYSTSELKAELRRRKKQRK